MTIIALRLRLEHQIARIPAVSLSLDSRRADVLGAAGLSSGLSEGVGDNFLDFTLAGVRHDNEALQLILGVSTGLDI